MDAYLAGLDRPRQAGHDLSKIHSVASFFVSRVDTEIDKRLERSAPTRRWRCAARPASRTPGWPTPRTRRSSQRRPVRRAEGRRRAGAAPAVGLDRGEEPGLLRHPVRHRTGRPDTVNTMPEKTLTRFADHGEINGDTVTGTAAQAQGCSTRSSRRHRPDRRVPSSWRTRAWRSSRSRGRSCSTQPRRSWKPRPHDHRQITPAVPHPRIRRYPGGVTRCGTSRIGIQAASMIRKRQGTRADAAPRRDRP